MKAVMHTHASEELKEYIRSQIYHHGYTLDALAQEARIARWRLNDVLLENPSRHINATIMNAFIVKQDMFDVPKLCNELKILPSQLSTFIASRPSLVSMCLTLYYSEQALGSHEQEKELG